MRLFDALLDACVADPNARLPELFAGFDRSATPDLVPYPTACSPQAWATGAIFLAVRTILGIDPEARPDHWRRLELMPRADATWPLRGLDPVEAPGFAPDGDGPAAERSATGTDRRGRDRA
jgi:hypothetical protein